MAQFHLYNTLGRELQLFEPIDKKTVKLYACGPTVYKDAHIGNFRTFITVDILRRALELGGYKVKHVMNITDVGHLSDDGDEGEDKMIKEARERGMDVWDIARFFTDSFFTDFEALNLKRPTIVCKATEHVDDMIALVQKLEDRGYTYNANGNVYFDTSKFPTYSTLALLDGVELQSTERVGQDEGKKNPQDFVLWFTNSKFSDQAMQWDSPWGRGYPGWHLECSAMSIKYLGEQFDIHLGGVDLVPTHHTNEIAQSEAATGKSPWVKHWVHGEFLLTGKDKMSKSTGNYLSVKTLPDRGWQALDYRFFCFSANYRTQLSFSQEAMDGAKAARQRMVKQVAKIYDAAGKPVKVKADIQRLPQGTAFLEDLQSDLNTPKALSRMWDLLKSDASPGDALATIEAMDQVLGLNLIDNARALVADQEKQQDQELPSQVVELVEARTGAKKAKDFAAADKIRDQLAALGYGVTDTAQGPVVKSLNSL